MTVKIYQDYSKIANYEACPRSYFIQHILKLTTSSTAADFGKLMHKILSSWYHKGDMQLCFKLIDEWQDKPEDEMHTRAKARTLLGNYLTRFAVEPWQKVIANEVPVECKLEIPEAFAYFMQEELIPKGTLTPPMSIDGIEMPEFYLIGKVDLVVEWGSYLYGCDWKTTSQLGSKYFMQFKPGLQMWGYTFALQQLFGDKVQGMLVRAISKAKTASPDPDAKTKMFDSQLIGWLPSEIKRYPESMIPKMYACWRAETAIIGTGLENYPEDISYQTRAIHFLNRPGNREAIDFHFPPREISCSDYGSCKFRDLCLSNLHPEELSKLQPNNWDPREVSEE